MELELSDVGDGKLDFFWMKGLKKDENKIYVVRFFFVLILPILVGLFSLGYFLFG